jgi:dTDP-4-dehydrorhamnose reductase
MTRILVCGSNGLLGQRLALLLCTQTQYEVLNTSHHRSFVFDRQLFDYTQLDIRRKGDTKSLISSFQPDVIVNAAAVTDVDWCEEHREEAWHVNVVGVENLVEAAKKVGAKLIHASTDYVFDGRSGPYSEQDRPAPLSYYGKTKLAGENAVRISGIPHAIVRTVVLFGYGIDVRDNFALWVVKKLQAGKRIHCATDMVGNPTYVADLSYAVTRIFELNRKGLFHLCGPERLSRFEFAHKIARAFELDGSLIAPVVTAELDRPAHRPLSSGFITLRAETELGFKPMALDQALVMMKREMETQRRN